MGERLPVRRGVSMTQLILIRHGSTDAVGKLLSGRAAGHALNTQGRAQIRALAAGLREVHLQAVYSSPLERARDTAAALASGRGLPVLEREALTDIDFGNWTGRAISELREDPLFVAFNCRRTLGHPPEGERICRVQARMVDTLQELIELHPSSAVAVVGHADPIRLALAFFIGIPVDLAHRLEVEPASASALELSADDVRLLYLNRTYP